MRTNEPGLGVFVRGATVDHRSHELRADVRATFSAPQRQGQMGSGIVSIDAGEDFEGTPPPQSRCCSANPLEL